MARIPEKFLIIIGSPKAGTTTLANWLGARDDMVLGPVKEPRFFTDFAERSWAGPGHQAFLDSMISEKPRYLANFENDRNAEWAIDGSTDYLWCPASPGLIREFADTRPTKLICVLRDPVERALSQYNHTLRDNLEDQPLARALELEDERRRMGWQPLFYHLRRSQIAADLARYADLFGNDLLILGFHEFARPESLLRKIHDFLGLSGPLTPPGEVKNRSDLPRNRLMARLYGNKRLKALGRRLIGPRQRARLRRITHAPTRMIRPASEAEKDLLRSLLADEIAACQASSLIDTSHWKTALGAQGGTAP